MKKRQLLRRAFFASFFFFFLFSLSGQSLVDLRGEAFIKRIDGDLYLVNYDQEIVIPSDGSFELFSSSYLYLTIEASDEVEIKSIHVAGKLSIRGDMPGLQLSVGSNDNMPDVAIKCGSLEVTEHVNLKTIAATCGIESASSIEVSGGEHAIFGGGKSHTPSTFSVKAGTYINIEGETTIFHVTGNINEWSNVYADTGIWAGSYIRVNGAALSSKGVSTGIECTGIELISGGTINASVADINTGNYGVWVNGNGNLIAEPGTKITGVGKEAGIKVEKGFIRVDGAEVEGTKLWDASSSVSAVNAPGRIYIVNSGTVLEIYTASGIAFDESTILDYPAIANNVQLASNYTWVTNSTTVTGSRNTMQLVEKVKLEEGSLHEIRLENVVVAGDKKIEIKMATGFGELIIPGLSTIIGTLFTTPAVYSTGQEVYLADILAEYDIKPTTFNGTDYSYTPIAVQLGLEPAVSPSCILVDDSEGRVPGTANYVLTFGNCNPYVVLDGENIIYIVYETGRS